MTAERDSMTLNEISYPSLGVEERSDKAHICKLFRALKSAQILAETHFGISSSLAPHRELRIRQNYPEPVGS